MDTMFKFGRKVVFSKTILDARLGKHEESYYDEERFITFGEQRYALRGRSRTEESSWEYNELFEVTRDQVTAYHITTDYQDLLQKDLEENEARRNAEGKKEEGKEDGPKE
jgi:hypothetical protein